MTFPRVLLSAVALALLTLSATAFGTVHVRGYTRKDGTYVPPHNRSSPNSTKADNWSTQGNVNPYTGEVGTKKLDATQSTAGDIPAAAAASEGNAAAVQPVSALPYGLTERELIQRLYEKIVELEMRLAQLEGKGAAHSAPTASTRQTLATEAGPSIEAWMQLKASIDRAAVLRILGKPASITNAGNGELWKYEGGGWVEFFNSGSVYRFGGYTAR